MKPESAAYHAAEAYIFEQTGRPAKTHRGLRSQFSNLARQEVGIDRGFLTFLAEGYQLKAIADYGIGSEIGTISAGDAETPISTAAKFVDAIAGLIPP